VYTAYSNAELIIEPVLSVIGHRAYSWSLSTLSEPHGLCHQSCSYFHNITQYTNCYSFYRPQ